MSERFYYDFDPYHDLLPDRDYDIYSRNEYARSCQEDLPQWRPHDDSGMYTTIVFHSCCSVFTHIPTSYSITVSHSKLLSFIPFLFSIVLCSGIATFFDKQDGQTQWSPLTEIMKFSKNHSYLLNYTCLNNLKFFEQRKS